MQILLINISNLTTIIDFWFCLLNNLTLGMKEDSKSVLVIDLLKLLYEKACHQNLWGLVRHTAGMLGKRVEDLTKALTDLLVRQKQVNFI